MMVVVDYSGGIFVPRIEIGGGVIAWSSISFVGVAVFYTHLDMSGFFCIGGGLSKVKEWVAGVDDLCHMFLTINGCILCLFF